MNSLENLTQDRHHQAERNYQQGLSKLRQVQAAQFANPQVLREVAQHLSAALRQNRTHVKYYTGMAYFLLLINEPQKAQSYLIKAQQLAPEDEQVLLLQQGLKDLQNLDTAQARRTNLQVLQNQPNPSKSHEYETLYETVEQILSQQIHLFLNAQISTEVSLNPDQSQKQKLFWRELQLFLASVNRKLELLYEELEVVELAQQLRPLRQLEQRLSQTLSYHRQFKQVRQEIEEAELQIQDIFFLLRRRPPGYTQEILSQMDQLYDGCDVLADTLDALESKTSIALLSPAYEGLVKRVQHLQDILDEYLTSV